MNVKMQILVSLKEELGNWEAFLNDLSEEQITMPNVFGEWSIKDVIAHLAGWQQLSVARLEACLEKDQPKYPEWFPGQDPDDDELLYQTNKRIYQSYCDVPWQDVHSEWHKRYQRVVVLCETISESDLIAKGMFTWLGDFALSAVLEGTIEHHKEHLFPLIENLKQ